MMHTCLSRPSHEWSSIAILQTGKIIHVNQYFSQAKIARISTAQRIIGIERRDERQRH